MEQFSQEFRFTSNNPDSRFDWIAGLYLKKDKIDKTDRFIGENFLGTVLPGGNNPLSTLSGENLWVNNGEIENYAGFAQIGFKFTDTLKLSVGARYTNDKKEGRVSGLVVATGDRFSPNDPRPNVTIEGLCRTPAGTVVYADAGCMPRAEPVDLLRRHGIRYRLLGELERDHAAGDPRLAGDRRPVPVRHGREGLQRRRLRRHAGKHRAGVDAVRSGRGDQLRARRQDGSARRPHAAER